MNSGGSCPRCWSGWIPRHAAWSGIAACGSIPLPPPGEARDALEVEEPERMERKALQVPREGV